MGNLRFRFRQVRHTGKDRVFAYWHYWGYVDGTTGHFVSPLTPTTGGESYQWTGLQDKNGGAIYEGDIALVIMGGEESRHEIRWHGYQNYPAFDLWPHFDTECNGLSYVVQGVFEDVDCSIEIIGNVHQNLELLEPHND